MTPRTHAEELGRTDRTIGSDGHHPCGCGLEATGQPEAVLQLDGQAGLPASGPIIDDDQMELGQNVLMVQAVQREVVDMLEQKVNR